MEIIKGGQPTGSGPADRFTGAVFLDPLCDPEGSWTVGATIARFAPGARTHWHTHPRGQLLWVVAGEGRCQSEGAAVQVIRAGDIVRFSPGENHWHGAAPTASSAIWRSNRPTSRASPSAGDGR